MLVTNGIILMTLVHPYSNSFWAAVCKTFRRMPSK